MTIAVCYMSPEGVVLGADSTTSVPISTGPGVYGFHYLNHNQKVFELGENSTVGVVTWGLGGLASASHRTLLGVLADSIQSRPPTDVKDIADRWATQFWNAYTADPLLIQFRAITNKQPYNPSNPTDPNARTEDEEKNLPIFQRNLFVGFFIAGYWLPDRTPIGFEIPFDPMSSGAPSPKPIPLGSYSYGGAPNVIKRLINGADDNLKDKIMTSGKWTGSDADLTALLNQFILFHPILPIRDAIDFVHSCIYSTIKAQSVEIFEHVSSLWRAN